MSNTKLVDNKRRNHAEKILRSASKKTSNTSTQTASVVKTLKKNMDPSLREQYDVIRKDLLKLRDDLAKGYDLAREALDKKSIMKQLMSFR